LVGKDGRYRSLLAGVGIEHQELIVRWNAVELSGSGVRLFCIDRVKLHTSFPNPPTYNCASSTGAGQTNQLGLNEAGTFAIKEMMRRGMIIDIDHMADFSKNAANKLANEVNGHYPLNSGHASLRGFFPTSGFQTPAANREINERSMSAAQYKAIAQLHGMAGVGSGNLDAFQWAEMYEQVIQAMQVGAHTGVTVSAGFGTIHRWICSRYASPLQTAHRSLELNLEVHGAAGNGQVR
jgi:hypothetical protein